MGCGRGFCSGWALKFLVGDGCAAIERELRFFRGGERVIARVLVVFICFRNFYVYWGVIKIACVELFRFWEQEILVTVSVFIEETLSIVVDVGEEGVK